MAVGLFAVIWFNSLQATEVAGNAVKDLAWAELQEIRRVVEVHALARIIHEIGDRCCKSYFENALRLSCPNQ